MTNQSSSKVSFSAAWALGAAVVLLRELRGVVRIQRVVRGAPRADAAVQGQALSVARDITELVEAEKQACTAQLRLADAVDGIFESLMLYDAEDRLVLANRACHELNAAVEHTIRPGVSFEDHLRAGMAAGLFPDAEGNEEERNSAAGRCSDGGTQGGTPTPFSATITFVVHGFVHGGWMDYVAEPVYNKPAI